MLHCVMQCFLRKPVEFLFDLERQVRFIPQFRQYFNPVPRTDCCCLSLGEYITERFSYTAWIAVQERTSSMSTK